MCLRISNHPILDNVKGKEVNIIVDGKNITCYEGEPIAAALLANNINVFRYTEKRKEPRSLFCGIGQCNDCVVTVNNTPNIRSCVTLVEDGMVIETMNGLGRFGVL